MEKEIADAKKLKKRAAPKRNYNTLKAKRKFHMREARRLRRMLDDLRALYGFEDE